jgi:hypothetical protein
MSAAQPQRRRPLTLAHAARGTALALSCLALGALAQPAEEKPACVGKPGAVKRALARSLPKPGTTWIYSAGPATTHMLLARVDTAQDRVHYQVKPGDDAAGRSNERALVEVLSTYTDPNPARQGTKRLLAFPLTPGKRWTDDFSERGIAHRGDASYRYHYEARAESHVAGVERVRVGAGEFEAVVIDRTEQWHKSAPQLLQGSEADHFMDEKSAKEQTGITCTQSWYVPELGRVVLRAILVTGDPMFCGDKLYTRAAATVIELVRYDDGKRQCAGDARAAPI